MQEPNRTLLVATRKNSATIWLHSVETGSKGAPDEHTPRQTDRQTENFSLTYTLVNNYLVNYPLLPALRLFSCAGFFVSPGVQS